MKLFEVTNGFVHYGDKAIEDLAASELCSNTSVEWVSNASDEGPDGVEE